jgi:hypothetical protein
MDPVSLDPKKLTSRTFPMCWISGSHGNDKEECYCPQRQRGPRHQLSSPAQKLRSWVRIALEALISLCVFCVCVVLWVGRGLATG